MLRILLYQTTKIRIMIWFNLCYFACIFVKFFVNSFWLKKYTRFSLEFMCCLILMLLASFLFYIWNFLIVFIFNNQPLPQPSLWQYFTVGTISILLYFSWPLSHARRGRGSLLWGGFLRLCTGDLFAGSFSVVGPVTGVVGCLAASPLCALDNGSNCCHTFSTRQNHPGWEWPLLWDDTFLFLLK